VETSFNSISSKGRNDVLNLNNLNNKNFIDYNSEPDSNTLILKQELERKNNMLNEAEEKIIKISLTCHDYLRDITNLRQLQQESNDKNDHIQAQYKSSLSTIETLTHHLEEASSTALKLHNQVEE